MTKNRDATFDIMKGVAMLIVIAFHIFPNETCFFSYWRSALFFIISGYFAKEWTFKVFLQKGAKPLLIPYVVVCLFMLPFVFIGEHLFNVSIVPIALKSILMGSTSFGYLDKWNEVNIGPLWFLCALFWVRLMWFVICKIPKDYARGVIVVLLALVSCVLKGFVINPWSFLSACGALGFFFSGYIVRKYDLLGSERGKIVVLPLMVLLAYCMGFSNMVIASCSYSRGYIIELLASIAAFMLLYAFVQRFADVKYLPWRFLNFFGRYSLVVFCLHAVDQCINVHWFPLKIWSFFMTEYELLCSFVIRVGIVALGAFLISKNKFLREKIFFIN